MRASKPTKNYKLLILDGYGSHAIFAFKHIAYLNRIILLYLPSHTTHKLQPCDVGMFSPLTIYYSNEVKNKAQLYNKQKMSKREYIEWILLTRDKANSKKNIVSSFRKCGIIPFKPNHMLRQLKKTKLYTDILIVWLSISDRLKTPTNQIAPSITVKDSTHILHFPIKDVAVYHNWLNRLAAGTSFAPIHIVNFKGAVEYQATAARIKKKQFNELKLQTVK